MKDSPYMCWVKHLFRVHQDLTPEQSQEANQVGANAFTSLYFYVLISSFIFAGLSSWVSSAQLFRIAIMANFVVAFIVLGGLYVKQSLVLMGVKDLREVPTTNRGIVLFAIRQGLSQTVFFWVFMVFVQITDGSLIEAIENRRILLAALFVGIATGSITLATDLRHRN